MHTQHTQLYLSPQRSTIKTPSNSLALNRKHTESVPKCTHKYLHRLEKENKIYGTHFKYLKSKIHNRRRQEVKCMKKTRKPLNNTQTNACMHTEKERRGQVSS